MPELPDIAVYCESIERELACATLRKILLPSVFVLRTVEPAVGAFEGRRLIHAAYLGKRVVLEFEGDLFAVIHLMIAGRFKWFPPGSKVPMSKIVLARFEFDRGTLALTEAGTRRRASLHLLRGRDALAAHDPGGIDPLTCTLAEFTARLQHENHTLKRALTDPRSFSGIGNSYSDEILHRAKLSPLALSQKLSASEVARLRDATREVMDEWLQRLRAESAGKFPEKVTAFRSEMAVHGKFKQPCPVCGSPVQRIVYAENECNYCPKCQTGGKLLADRALSRLLKSSWPKSIDELS
ncbi:MAG: formamidopyrimidine-DNA glycosylase [Betaproteobacteria bacterium]|nr:formamidopyrimidine-DNA glycosylase [Betaproteobacteria bacterium]